MQLLRISGCAGVMASLVPLQSDARLNRAAALWAQGSAPAAAAQRSGYPARNAVGLQLSGSDDAIMLALRRSHCHPVADPALRSVGVYYSAAKSWLVIAAPDDSSIQTSVTSSTGTTWTTLRPAVVARNSPNAPAANSTSVQAYSYTTAPEPSRAPPARTRVLALVNEVRARGTRCGDKAFGHAPPLQLSTALNDVAGEHAADMARHNYFEHVDLKGNSPADRVRASGYREKLVGENIAYGPDSADEVVAGWLHSTGHCENIMDPRFAEMGLALEPGKGTRRGLYWDQVLAAPAL